MNKVQIFEGQEVKIITDKGNLMYNLVHVAKCCGLTRIKNNAEYVNWKDNRGVIDKLKKLIPANAGKDVSEEIKYILEEIENTDDRNSIFVSSWLAKRLAVECHSEKANKFKNWLVDLDETRENGLVVQQNVGEIQELASNMLVMGQMLQGLQKFTYDISEKVRDSIVAKDRQIDEAMELIGLRSRNVFRLVAKLKETMLKKYNEPIRSKDPRYISAKYKVMKEFNVDKWEEIPIGKYNSVYAFIENLE